jgi:two-component system, NarL family, nitrate/nitrite response regulator NarL
VSAELTPRQREIMDGMVEGLTNAQIADRLGISPSTVTNHIADVRRKLGLHNRVQLAVWAARHGLDPPPC